ncbi:MAG: hypothetical protein HDS65_06400 [Bacteroidales bacterium]|nr:hypothetical protein [Bacteroidales bacterium]
MILTHGQYRLLSNLRATITVWAAAASNGDPENFKLVMGTTANAAELAESGTTLVERTGFSSYTFTKFTESVTPDETGEYYFGFNCFSEAENYGMYATGFKVDKMVDIETGVTSVAVDAAATVLYDLRGNVVSGKPARGVYVKVSGGKATKVIY